MPFPFSSVLCFCVAAHSLVATLSLCNGFSKLLDAATVACRNFLMKSRVLPQPTFLPHYNFDTMLSRLPKPRSKYNATKSQKPHCKYRTLPSQHMLTLFCLFAS